MILRRVALLSAVIAGCGGGDPGAGVSEDAADGAQPDAGTALVVAVPGSPVLTPCPAGWVEVVEDGVTACAPHSGVSLDCGPGEAHFPGTAACGPVGRRCPGTRFPDPSELETDRPILFVDGSRPAGGDGTRERPLAGISAAIAVADVGTLLVLAPGRYELSAHLRSDLEIRGACAGEVRLVPAGGAIFDLAGSAAVTVRDVTLGPSTDFVAFEVSPSSKLDLRGVVVAGISGGTVLGHLEVEDSVFRSAPIVVDWGSLSGANLAFRHVLVEHSGQLRVATGAHLALSDVLFRRGTDLALRLSDPGPVDLQAVAFDDTPCAAVYMFGGPIPVLMRDVVVRGGRSCADDSEVMAEGRGFDIFGELELDLERVRIRDAREAGLSLHGDGEQGMRGTIGDLLIGGVQGREGDRAFGYGLAAQGDAELRMTRVLLAGNHAVGLLADRARLTLTDFEVRDTRSDQSTGWLGRGITAQQGARVDLSRAVIRGNRELGVALIRGAVVIASDLRIADTRARACAEHGCRAAPFGTALAATLGTVSLDRFVLEQGPLCGLQLHRSQVDLRRGRVSGFGVGVCMETAGYDLTRLEFGVSYENNGADLRATSLPVPDVTTTPL